MSAPFEPGTCVVPAPRTVVSPASKPGLRDRWRALVRLRAGFHRQMACAGVATLAVCFVGCRLTQIRVTEAGTFALGGAVIAAVALPVLLYLEEKGKRYLREAILTILWAIFSALVLGIPVTIAARLAMGRALADEALVRWDRVLGVDVARIVAWAPHHWLGMLSIVSYAWVFPLMQAAIFLPIVAGKVKYAQQFLAANLVSFMMGLPLFALFPAVGSWYGFHLIVRPDQAACQAFIMAMRQPGPYVYQFPAGAICLPSYHVIWALLGVQALWWMRPLRIPLALLGALIVFSAITAGNHYFCDVLAGIAVAAVSMYAGHRMVYRKDASPHPASASKYEIEGTAR